MKAMFVSPNTLKAAPYRRKHRFQAACGENSQKNVPDAPIPR